MTEPRLVGDRYELDGVVGRGGMAEVYRGRDLRLDRQVAVKTLRADLARDPTFQERFRREAQSAASLNHPSVIAVYDTGEDLINGSTVPYIVMEYVAGRTLRDMLQDDRHLLPERGLEIIEGILRALEYSHAHGIVHRDIKPANVMITTSREVKVMDFGIARAVHDSASTMTQTAQVVGTAQYLSPEQARGERVDARSDVYSTGCVLYEVLVGHPPFRGDSPVSIAYQHVREEPIPPSQIVPNVPQWADAIVLRAMTKDAGSRYQSAAEMRGDVQRALAGEHLAVPSGGTATQQMGDDTALMGGGASTTQALPEQTQETGRRRRRRWPWIVAPVVLVLALAGIGGWALSQQIGPDTTQVPVPRVLGLNEEAARSTLQNEGFTVTVKQGFTREQARGEVYRQRPKPKQMAPKSSNVTIFVSQGSQTVQVPTGLVGKSQNDAIEALRNAGLQVGKVSERASSKQPEGHVLATSPSGGEQVRRDSSVDLIVSSGVATVQVPSVTGTHVNEAYATLSGQGFQVDKEYVTTTAQPPGFVTDQNPDPGTTVKKGSTVTITIAQAPQETNEPTTPPTTPPASTPEETPPTEGGDGDGEDGGILG